MNDLLVGALDRTTADSVAQAQVLVVAHPMGVFAVVADQLVELLTQLRCARTQPLKLSDNLSDFACAQILRNAVGPSVCLFGAFAISEAGKLPCVLERMPEVEDFAADQEHRCPVPDPL